MGGSKQSTSVQIPAWLEDAAQANIAKANELAKIGYTPYYGPDVAAMTAPQLASMQGTNQAAMAFGVPTADFNSGMPQAQNYNGMAAYSSGGMYGSAIEALKNARPGQYNAIMAQFIDPILGTSPALSYGPPAQGGGAPWHGGGGANPWFNTSGSTGEGPRGVPGGSGGGYGGIRDMVDGGGPGASGSTFSGGPLSGAMNRIGVDPVGSKGGGGGMGGGK